MVSFWKKIILIISILLLAGGLVIYGAVVQKIAFTLTHVPRKTIQETPAKFGTPFRELTFPSRDKKETLGGWYISKPTNKYSLIIINGIGDTRSNLQRVDLASRLARLNFNILMFDFRGQGTSTGTITSGGYFEQQDVLGAVDFVRQQSNSSKCLGVLSASMGAATTILMAPHENAIQAIVADSSYADINDLLTSEIAHASPQLPRQIIPFLLPGINITAKLKYGIHLTSLKPIEAIAQISYPVFFIHGEKDQRIPVSQSERLLKAAAKGSEIWLVPEAEHANGFAHAPAEYTQKVSDYFIKQLSQPACQPTR